QFEKGEATTPGETTDQPSMLRHWPVQLTLVPPTAPFLQGADVVLAADCVPFAYANFHRDFLRDHSLIIACPKLDDFQAHLNKLTDVLKLSSIKSLTVVHMEVPCCSGLVHMARQAIQQSGKDIPLSEITISAEGKILTAAR
ncbi:4Fe-4S ferredoxin, partial [Chloroflexota bacterium]